jgi:IMP dehydrogenase
LSEKLILVQQDGTLKGLITMKDIRGTEEFPSAARDGRGRLLVGAAVGVHDLARVGRLVEAGCDVVVVDTALVVIAAIIRIPYHNHHPPFQVALS